MSDEPMLPRPDPPYTRAPVPLGDASRAPEPAGTASSVPDPAGAVSQHPDPATDASQAPQPPRLARSLVRRLLPEHVDGDLLEGFARRHRERGPRAAARWYRMEVLRCLARWPTLRPSRSPDEPRPRLPRPDMLLQDLRFALRTLLRRPGFAAVVIVTLALGIGANATIFSVLNGLFLRPVPGVAQPERVVELYGSDSPDANAGAFRGFLPMSWPTIDDVARQAATLEGVYAYMIFPASMLAGEEAERVMTGFVSDDYFTLLGVRPMLGRTFAPEEGVQAGGAAVAVLSHGFWTSRFGADTAVVGRTLDLNVRTYTVVGVAPAGFRGTSTVFGPDLWVPLPMIRDIPFWGPVWENRAARMFFAGARIADGRSLEDAQAELAAVGARLAETHPEQIRERTILAVPLAEAAVFPNARGSLLGVGVVLMAVVALLLVIACINVANLLLARGLGRRREMAIRTSVGAGRARLAMQLATESLVLFGLGGAAGVGLALLAQRTLGSLDIPLVYGLDISLDLSADARVLGFAAAVTLGSAMAFGMFPAWGASSGDVATDLRDGDARTGRGGPGRWMRGGLVVAQVAFSLVALVGGALFARSLDAARAVDPGFEPERLAMISVDLGAQRYDEDEGLAYYRAAVEALHGVPGVESAAVGEVRPLTPAALQRVRREDQPREDSRLGHMVRAGSVSSGYFETMGIAVERGRGFRASDDATATDVAVVNSRLAELLWPGRDPLGQRVFVGLEEAPVEVVGVVPTGKYDDLTEEPQPVLYRPVDQLYPPSATLFVRWAARSPDALATARRTVADLDPSLPLFDVEPATALLGRTLWVARAVAVLLGAFGLVGLLLAAVGIYGVVAHSVRERTREMGLRIALGAGAASVLVLALRQVMALAVAGSLLGIGAAALLARPLRGLLFGTGADPLMLAGLAALLLTVAAAAAWLPARRATRVDPVEALRSD